MHEKGLRKQKGDGPLVSSQEQKTLLAPRSNRLSTGRQPVGVFLHLFEAGFRLLVLLVFDALFPGLREVFFSWGNSPVLAVPARPFRTAAPPRIVPLGVCPFFGFVKLRIFLIFSNMPYMKRVYKDQWTSVHWSVASNKERFSTL